MQRISITNPQNIIDGTAKKYYFKLRNTGGPKGDKGEKGDTGSQGPQGPQGDPCTVVVNSTATLEPGSNAYVTNTGSLSNAVLNFGIPKGDRGPQGAKGDKGDTGAQGETGPRGPQGERGTNATVYIGTTSTLNPGTQATVYNSGSDSNAVLNFGIPQGAKGDTGNQGPQGPTGPAGQNFAPTIVAELPTTGDESKLYLTPKARTTQTATGNPITATITEEAGKIESFKLDGDTFQQSYTGQNLYNVAEVDTGTYVTKDNDGWITITRDNTSGDSTVYTNVWTGNLALETSTQYKIFIEVKAVSGTGSLFITSTNSTEGQFSSWQEKTLANIEAGKTYTVSPTTKSSFSGITKGLRTVLQQTAGQGGSVTFRLSVCAYSTPTDTFSYEPYTGLQPSPSPDYPQPIQTVTGRQVVTVSGKNKLRQIDGTYSRNGITATVNNGKITLNGTATANVYLPLATPSGYYSLYLNGAYTLSATRITGVSYSIYHGASSVLYSTSSSQTKTLSGTYEDIRFQVNVAQGTTLNNVVVEAQLEAGSTATAYAPYSKQTLPISLGSIELCKLGTYQDYIWKDGEDWKVHKDIGEEILQSSGWAIRSDSSVTNGSVFRYIDYVAGKFPTNGQGLSSHFKVVASTNMLNTIRFINTNEYGFNVSIANSAIGIESGDSGQTKANKFMDWLSENSVSVYYQLATPTDTTITDQTLIAQLEAIRTASLENGANTITNTATGSNLAGDMEIGYYGYNPRNRYDKWLWLDINNEYEQIGS